LYTVLGNIIFADIPFTYNKTNVTVPLMYYIYFFVTLPIFQH